MYIPTLDKNYYSKPINLDITNKCTLQCPTCPRQASWYDRKLYNDLSIEDLKKISETFYYIEFCGFQSDPIFHPNFIHFIFLLQMHKLDIHTAASHKKKEFYEEAFSVSGKNTTWIFGLDGLPKDSHKHRINQDGEHLFEMMKLGRKMNVNIVWQYIVFKYNQNDIDTAKKIAIDNNIEFKLSYSSRWSGVMSKLKPDEKYCA